MIEKLPDRAQKDLFQPLLCEFINLEHELILLSEEINRKELENEFSPLYSSTSCKI
jgi:IS5 family transposase